MSERLKIPVELTHREVDQLCDLEDDLTSGRITSRSNPKRARAIRALHEKTLRKIVKKVNAAAIAAIKLLLDAKEVGVKESTKSKEEKE